MNKRNEFVEIAKSQIGIKESNTNNVKYNTWYYGHAVNGTPGTSEYAWCVTFECWCAYMVGILNTLIPKCNNVGILRGWYNARGLYHFKDSYTPKKGDLIIFRNASHTGIVERTEGGRIWTIEGNSKDKVSNNNYSLKDSYIQGYCQVKFNDNTTVKTYSGTFPTLPSRGYFKFNPKTPKVYYDRGTQVIYLQKFLNWAVNAGLLVDGVLGLNTYNAIKIFQKKVGFTGSAIDGLFGKNSLAKAKTFKK